MRRALISVSDKTGVIELAKFIQNEGYEIISTGGTGKTLKEAGISFIPIQEITGNPESFGGRMKTISFEISSSLLYRRNNSEDVKDAQELGVKPIDLVICNLYPFEEVAKVNGSIESLVDNIDIGGPTMIRAAAKNYNDVTVLTSPAQYDLFMSKFGALSIEDRFQFSLAAFKLCASYDQFIFTHLTRNFTDNFPSPLALKSDNQLRYGENPHQKAWIAPVNNSNQKQSLAQSTPIQGKALSYNNMLDADAAWKCTSDLYQAHDKKAVMTIVKHGNPCGVSLGARGIKLLEDAWSCDPVSSFGSVVCYSHEWDIEMANWLNDKFVEIIIAPHFTPEAKIMFQAKKNLRLIELAPKERDMKETTVRSINGGLLIQDEDEKIDYEFCTKTKKELSTELKELRLFGMIVNKYIKSNGITLVGKNDHNFILAGAGMGQPNRLDSLSLLAAPRARSLGHNLNQLLLISDAFFPFKDSIEVCREVGIKNIIQPGGSIRDEEVIAACDEFEIAMEFSSVRHFRH